MLQSADIGKVGLAILAVVAVLFALVFASYRWGQSSCKLNQAEAQRDAAIDTRKAYENIDRNLPSDADLPGVADFLLRRAKGN